MWATPQSTQARKPLSRKRADLDDGALAPDRRHASRSRGTGTADGASGKPRLDQLARHRRPCCFATGATPGSGLPSVEHVGGVADHEDVRVARHREIRRDHARGRRDPSRRRATCRPAKRARPPPRRSCALSMRSVPSDTPAASQSVTAASSRTSTPSVLERAPRRRRQSARRRPAAAAARPRPG